MVDNYKAENIEILEGLEAVRKRPGMYIGGLDDYGLHKLFFEVLDNSVDEHSSGYSNNIVIDLDDDGTISIKDDGRGIPVEEHPVSKTSALEVVLCTLHAGGKFSEDNYKFSSGLHGVGVSVVNALSDKLTAEVFRNGKHWIMTFSKGKKTSELQFLSDTTEQGTKITFRPDSTMFGNFLWKENLIHSHLFYVSNLNSDIKIEINYSNNAKIDNVNLRGTKVSFLNGSMENILSLTEKNPLLTKSVFLTLNEKTIILQLLINYSLTENDDNTLSFVNNVFTSDGGTHVSLVRGVFTRYLNDMFKKRFPKKNALFTSEDVRAGLQCVIHMKITDPIFSGQTKGKLSSDLSPYSLNTSIYKMLYEYFIDNTDVLESILLFVDRNRQQRLSVEQFKIKEGIKSFDSIDSGTLPGKLAECSSKVLEERELMLVEGDSAGGTAKQARDRKFQAILSLRGKFLNVEKSTAAKIKQNAEVRAVFTAIGFPSAVYDVKKLRYGKVIILSDADPDGHHIRVLFLTFFMRFLREMIMDGRVFIAQPPIYMIGNKTSRQYFYDEPSFRDAFALKQHSGFVQRFKGLGEMNADQLWETTMDPQKRKLICVKIEDEIEAEKSLKLLMGDDTTFRRTNLVDHLNGFNNSLEL